jgi:hypothetical protein
MSPNSVQYKPIGRRRRTQETVSLEPEDPTGRMTSGGTVIKNNNGCGVSGEK